MLFTSGCESKRKSRSDGNFPTGQFFTSKVGKIIIKKGAQVVRPLFDLCWYQYVSMLLPVMLYCDRLHPGFEQGNRFFFTAEGIVNIDEVVG